MMPFDEAIDARINPRATAAATAADDSDLVRYQTWKKWERRGESEKGSKAATTLVFTG